MRLQIDVTEEQDRQIESLMKQTGLTTKKDLFNNALTFFAWAVEEVATGNTIASVNEEKKRFRELQMPALSHVARAVKQAYEAASKRVVGVA
jgi:hypothetical protein